MDIGGWSGGGIVFIYFYSKYFVSQFVLKVRYK